MADRPNILVLLTDDHAQWALGCYGNREVRSPSMDWLSNHGIRMANAMTECPVCSPARASFWTGLLPGQHGIHDYLAPGAFRDGDWLEGQPLLGALLHEAGYACGFFGKWHCGRPEEPRPGFDRWCCIGRRTGPHHGEQEYWIDGKQHHLNGYQGQLTTDFAYDWLKEREGGKPWFAFVGLVSTHSPYNHQPPRLVEQYADATFDDIPDDITHPIGRRRPEGTRGDANWRHHRQQYYAAVSHLDEQLGKLIDHLDQTGQLDNTLIVYTGDHGLNCGHHGLWGKANATRPVNFVEETVRIPMLFGGWNQLKAQQTRGEFVDHTDLFATLVDIGGATLPNDRHYPGRSFADALTQARMPDGWKQHHCAEYGDARMVTDGNAKLIRRHGRALDELYDLVADPRETQNLIDVPGYEPVAASLDLLMAKTFDPIADSPFNGLRVASLREHNNVEPWRGEST